MTRSVFLFVASATLLFLSIVVDGTGRIASSDLATPVHAAAFDSSSEVPADLDVESGRGWMPSLGEPSTLLMMGGAFLGFAALTRRRTSSQQS